MHALLSPSSAHRWMNCTPSARMEEHVEDKGSAFAAEGSLAHAYCALKIKRQLGRPTADEEAEIDSLKEYYSGEMDEYTDGYAAMVMERYHAATSPVLLIEQTVTFEDWVPEGFGTVDAAVISDGLLQVIDFKYGKGVEVSAVGNPQMMIYALGMLANFGFDYSIDRVKMTIYQPRIGNFSDYEMTTADLLQWGEALKEKARMAWEGKGDFMPGEWCRFCKVKTRCRALAATTTAFVQKRPDPMLLTDEEIAYNVLPMLDTIKTWLSGMEDYTLKRALDGATFKGWKLVEGRSRRVVQDPMLLRDKLLKEGYQEDAIVKPMELKGITDLERLIGKQRLASIAGDLIGKPPGKPALVPESDKRPPLNSASEDFKDFITI